MYLTNPKIDILSKEKDAFYVKKKLKFSSSENLLISTGH